MTNLYKMLPKPKRKKSDRKKLVEHLDKVFSIYIRRRDKRCVCCGTDKNLQCGHLFSRNSYSTRWNDKNAYAQCSSHNLIHEHDPYPLTNYFLSMFGKEVYDDLHAVYSSQVKFGNAILEEMIEYYKGKTDDV